ncbi:MAG: carbohydrate kinase family protein [Bosea sp. (in: a-proteobacteria)]
MSAQPRIGVMGYLSIDTITTDGAVVANVPGGAALYAALGARALGAEVALIACAGEDYPSAWLERIAALGIDIAHVRRKSGPTRRARLATMAGGERQSAHHGEALWWERTEALAPELPGDLRVDCLSLAPMPPERAMHAARSANAPVLADTSAAFAKADRLAVMSLVKQLSCFAPSLEETRILLAGLSDAMALRYLAASGPDVVQKRGAAGMCVCAARQGLIRRVPSLAATEVDATGAGDATVGALAVGLARGLPLRSAAEQAAGIGARAVTGHGPSALGFTWEQTSGRLSA